MKLLHALFAAGLAAGVLASAQAQTTTLPDLDQGRLWVSPLAVLTTGVHAGYVLNEPSTLVGIQGARLEFNVYDQKFRLYALWRKDRSAPGNEQAFVEYGAGVANFGNFGVTWTDLNRHALAPSGYIAWGHTRRTLEWQRGRGKGTMPMTTMWGVRGEFLYRNGGGSGDNVGLYLPLFIRLQLPVG